MHKVVANARGNIKILICFFLPKLIPIYRKQFVGTDNFNVISAITCASWLCLLKHVRKFLPQNIRVFHQFLEGISALAGSAHDTNKLNCKYIVGAV